MEPLLRWAGGKRWQVPILKRAWYPHRHRRLVEPFCGGLSVALALEPDAGVMNDANPHLINFYRWCQRGLALDIDLVPEDYYANRQWFNDLIAVGDHESRDAAQLFYYLNRFGFNGLCRFNGSGEFNVPEGRASSEVKPLPTHLARHYLARYTFTCGDFGDVPVEPDDFIYADPPYDDGFTTYTGTAFTWEDQERVATLYAGHPGPVIITNHASERIQHLYRSLGYTVQLISAPRRIAASGDRTRKMEVIASNFPVDLVL